MTTTVTPKFARIALKTAHHAPALLRFLPMFRVAADAAGFQYADYQALAEMLASPPASASVSGDAVMHPRSVLETPQGP